MGVAGQGADVAEGEVATAPAFPSRSLGRVGAFDGVRAVAVILVVWFHVGVLRSLSPGLKPSGGFLGVDIFFVLSGFLITALLLGDQSRRGRVRFGAFYRRRALRLLPVVVLFLAAHMVFAAIVGVPASREHAAIIPVLLYYTNWYSIHARLPLAFGHLWSLAVEEQFYLVWPLAVALLTVRSRMRTVVAVLGGAIFAVAVYRAVLVHDGVGWNRLIVGTDTRADTILVGALLAHVWVRGRARVPHLRGMAWLATAFLAVCVLRCTYATGFLYRGGFTLIAIATAIVLLALLESEWAGERLLAARPLRALGRVSYGVYVFHPLVFWWVFYVGHRWNAGVRFFVAFAVLAAAVIASWRLVERPFLRWKDRLEGRVDARAAVAQVAAGV